jgi:glycosyltransferase involved in cell wall biosynthesis
MKASLRLLLPGDPLTATGGYRYDRRIVAALRELGWQVEVISLDHSFPSPTPAALCATRARLAAIPDGELTMIDGLALGAMPDEALAESKRLALIALIHHPLAAETGLAEARARVLRDSETRALRAARAVITTSTATAATLRADYAVPAERLHAIEPGVDRVAARPQRRATPSAAAAGPPLHLLCVGTLTPRKGHELLLRALAAQRCTHWHLHCIGSLERDRAEAQRLLSLRDKLGLVPRVSFHGEVTETRLQESMRSADLFVLASWYEGYGMAVAEALAVGLPVVTTTVGAATALLEGNDPEDPQRNRAGLLVAPGDLGALTQALDAILNDPGLRDELAAGARQRAAQLPTWQSAGLRFARVLETVRSA